MLIMRFLVGMILWSMFIGFMASLGMIGLLLGAITFFIVIAGH